MIIDAFNNKIFPKVSAGFEDDVDEDELLKKRQEEDGRLATIEGETEDTDNTFEQMTIQDKIYGPDLIRNYFIENSLTKILYKTMEEIIKNLKGITI